MPLECNGYPALRLITIGASAGGLDPLQQFFFSVASDTGNAFVVVQHLSPDFKSLMAELLAKKTDMPIVTVYERAAIEPNTVYLLPPQHDLAVTRTELISTIRTPANRHDHRPIDTLFCSAAKHWKSRSIAIVLSGSGSDGSAGATAIQENGGIVITQDVVSASFPSMPANASRSVVVDASLPPDQMPQEIHNIVANPDVRNNLLVKMEGVPLDVDANSYSQIFETISNSFSVDFEHYKTDGMVRRALRHQTAGSYQERPITEYGDFVKENKVEQQRLFDALFVGVSSFFRDSRIFDQLGQDLLQQIKERDHNSSKLRVWIAGCSTGEEAYTLAIVLLEAFAEAKVAPGLRIMATDVNPASIRVAGIGVYEKSAFDSMPIRYLEKYFTEVSEGYYRVSADLRRHLIFSNHNLLTDPPFNRLDLVSCRNVTLYFTPECQTRALAALHFSLEMGGRLLLGKEETPGELAGEFTAVPDVSGLHIKSGNSSEFRKHRISESFKNSVLGRHRETEINHGVSGRLEHLIVQQVVPCGFLVNNQFDLIHSYGAATDLIEARRGPVTGNLVTLLEVGLGRSVSMCLITARETGRTATRPCLITVGSDSAQAHEVKVDPVQDSARQASYFLIQILPAEEERVSVTNSSSRNEAARASAKKDEAHADQIGQLEEELEQSQRSLDKTVQMLAAANQELQAANEEMASGNEELQSANEELHSVNEELFSVNAEHEQKIRQLNEVSNDLNNLIQSTDIATIFLDLQYCIRLFTPDVDQFYGLLHSDIGRDIRDFSPKSPDTCLTDDLATVLSTGKTIERQVTDEDGQTFLRRASVYRDSAKQVAGVTLAFVDVSDLTRASYELAQSERRLKSIYNFSPSALWAIDLAGVSTELEKISDSGVASGVGRLAEFLNLNDEAATSLCAQIDVVDVNERAVALFGASDVARTKASLRDALVKGCLRPQLLSALIEFAEGKDDFSGEGIIDIDGAETDHVLMSWTLPKPGTEPCLAYVSAIDFQNRKQAEETLKASELRQRSLIDAVDSAGVAMRVVDKSGQVRYSNKLIAELLNQHRDLGIETLIEAGKAPELATKLAGVASQPDGTMFNERVGLADGRTLDLVAVPYREAGGRPCRLEIIRDVTGEEQANEAQRVAATTFETQQALLLLNPQAQIIRANRAFCELTGYSADKLAGQSISLLHEPAWQESQSDGQRRLSKASDYWQGELECKHKNGSALDTWCTASVVLDEQDRTTHYVVSYTDISERKSAEAKIMQLAFYDTLTELPNRRMLLDRLTQRLSASTRNKLYGALIFLDLDKFKELNDSKGHDVGDLLLKSVARRLTGALREGDTVARFGGDEFVVLLDELSTNEGFAGDYAGTVAETIRASLAKPYDEPELKNVGGASLGITLFTGHTHTVENLLKQADLALYQAKQDGRNSIRFYNPGMQARIDQRISLERSLRFAVENGQLVLFYQPQIDRAGKLIGAEALVRWQHPERGLIYPADFVQEAEESGLILTLGQWVLQTACFQLAAWQKFEATKGLELSVNISPRQFRQPDFVSSVRDLLKQTGASANLLKFEITEGVLLDDIEGAIHHMHQLREMGVRFAIDDFGTGYSSLSYLKRLPVDNLKIDQSFVKDVGSNPESAAIVRAIIAMGRTLHMQVTAEGVESKAQRQFLELEGCDVFQGYYYGHPVAGTSELLAQVH